MREQRELLESMLVEAERCVKELEPRLAPLMQDSEKHLPTVEGAVFEAVLRLGAVWLGLVLSLSGRRLAQAVGTRRACPCGGVQRWVSVRTKTILSLLGKVTYRRVYYHCTQCGTGANLGDQQWELAQTRTTLGVKQLVAYLNASLGVAETARQVCRTLRWPTNWLSAKQVQRLATPVGRQLGEREVAQVATWWRLATAGLVAQAAGTVATEVAERVTTPIRRLYVQMDGTMVRLRGTLGKGSDFWREVKVGAVFVAEAGPRASQLGKLVGEIVATPGQMVMPRVDRPQGAITYVAGRVVAAEFGVRVYGEAVRRGLERAHEVVILGDGAHWIWELAAEHFPGAVQILDFWHASQWVWKVAHAVFGEGSAKARDWAEAVIAAQVLRGDVVGLVEAIAALPAVPPPPDASRSIPEQAAEYFRRNAERMRYPEYRTRGLEIGSGAVESAGKRVVGKRCKGPGMRWSEQGLDAVLHLRTHVLNERFDAALAALPKAA